MQDYLAEMKEFYADELRKLGISEDFIENFEPAPVDDEEAFKERALEALREAGLNEELLEQFKQWMQESTFVSSKIPEDVRITQHIELLEGLNPELAGLSKTWKSIEPTTMFSTILTGVATIHELPEFALDKFKVTIEQFYEIIPAHQKDDLRAWTNHYFRLFLINYQFTGEDLLAAGKDKQVLNILKDKTELEVKGINRFLQCIDKENKKVNKKLRKQFTSFMRSLEKTMNSVLESLDSYDESSVDDQLAIRKVMLGLGRSSKVSNAVDGMSHHHCYHHVDIDQLRDLYGQYADENEIDWLVIR